MRWVMVILLLLLLVGCGIQEREALQLHIDNCPVVYLVDKADYQPSFEGRTLSCKDDLCCSVHMNRGGCYYATCYKR